MEKLVNNNFINLRNGFGTIEFLIYISIVTVVTIVLTNFIISGLKSINAARQARQIQQNTRLVMAKIIREVHGASSLQVLSEEEIEINTNGQISGFYLNGGVIYYYLNSHPVTQDEINAISTADIFITDLNFIQRHNAVEGTIIAEPAKPLPGSGNAYKLTSVFTPRQYVY